MNDAAHDLMERVDREPGGDVDVTAIRTGAERLLALVTLFEGIDAQ